MESFPNDHEVLHPQLTSHTNSSTSTGKRTNPNAAKSGTGRAENALFHKEQPATLDVEMGIRSRYFGPVAS
jgi:hypothetical protein